MDLKRKPAESSPGPKALLPRRVYNGSMSHPPRQNPADRADEDAYVLPIGDILQVLRRRLWVILLVTIMLTAIAVGVSLVLPPTYEASIKIRVGQEGGLTATPTDVVGLQQLTETMAITVATRPVAEEAIQKLDLKTTPDEFLEENLTAETIPETQIIEVSYMAPEAETAREVANTVGDVFQEQTNRASGSVTATVVDPAVTPETPASPNPLRNGLLALMIGAMLGTGLAFMLEFLDDSWRSPEEAEQISGVPTFGVIPQFHLTKSKNEGKERDGSRIETPEAERRGE